MVAAIGGPGTMNMDLMRTPDGLVVVDVNLRPWGSFVALRQTGVDFVGGWLDVLEGRERSYELVPGGRTVGVFSTTAINRGLMDPFRGLTSFISTSRTYLPWVGPRYLAAEWIRASAVVGRHWLRRGLAELQRRRAAAWAHVEAEA